MRRGSEWGEGIEGNEGNGKSEIGNCEI